MTDSTTPHPTPYEQLGGEAGVRALAHRFYEIMDELPEAADIRAMHASNLSQVQERLFEFLSGWLGGPPTYFQRADRPCIRSAHAAFAIGAAERDQWLLCMDRALREVSAPQAVLEQLRQPFFRMADMLRSA